jgi:hypothetical protein
MSSWTRYRVKIQNKPGYSQKKPEGIFDPHKTKPPTVVTAYYEMDSKASKETYKQRMALFLTNLPVYLIFFCEQDTLPFVQECRKDFGDRTLIIPLNRTEWNANIKYQETVWQSQLEKDPEKNLHSVDLYKLWYEKKEFVTRAIELNPYDHDDFIWMDAGIIRETTRVSLIKNSFPQANRIPRDRMLLLNVKGFHSRDEERSNTPSQITGNFISKDRIGGGIIAGHKDLWFTWSTVYDKIVDRYLLDNRFIGKDQSIMSTLVLENKALVSLINPPINFKERWLYSILYLGVSERRFNALNSDTKNTYDSYQSIIEIPES